MNYRVGLIGTGPKVRSKERGGNYAIGRVHADVWKALSTTDLVAACDINPINLVAFAEDYNVKETYENYLEMLQTASLDIVDICTWPSLHKEMVVAAAEHGVKGIYCEKPMCLSLQEAYDMLNACEKSGTKLVVSHQRRFRKQFQWAKKWIKEGRIGHVTGLQGSIHGNDADLLSWGTHWVDMFNFLLDDIPVESVFAQTDCTNARYRYGHRVEENALVEVKYSNGVVAVLRGNDDSKEAAGIRVIGDSGIIELFKGLRGMFSDNSGWEIPEIPIETDSSYTPAMHELVNSIKENRIPQEISGAIALKTTEIIMAAYESSRLRARVSLPLQQTVFPLVFREEYNQGGTPS